VAGLLFDSHEIVPDYVLYWALSEYENNRSAGRGGNQLALNGQRIRSLTLPLPPTEEQREVVRRVSSLMAILDSVETDLHDASRRAERLMQSVSGKAFRGELVPREADLAAKEGRPYESATELLKRIKAEKSADARLSTHTQAKPSGAASGASPRPRPKRASARHSTRNS